VVVVPSLDTLWCSARTTLPHLRGLIFLKFLLTDVRWRGSRGSDVWCLAEVALAWQTTVPIGVIQNK
jgi:hypothetical protein